MKKKEIEKVIFNSRNIRTLRNRTKFNFLKINRNNDDRNFRL